MIIALYKEFRGKDNRADYSPVCQITVRPLC